MNSVGIDISKHEMQSLASILPEYLAVMDMFGVGPTLDPQFIAENRRYTPLLLEESIGGLCRP